MRTGTVLTRRLIKSEEQSGELEPENSQHSHSEVWLGYIIGSSRVCQRLEKYSPNVLINASGLMSSSEVRESFSVETTRFGRVLVVTAIKDRDGGGENERDECPTGRSTAGSLLSVAR